MRKILWGREEELARGAAEAGDVFAVYLKALNEQRLGQLKLEQAESACRFALRQHNGQPSYDRLQGPARALAATTKVVVDARAAREKLECLEREHHPV